MERCRCGSDDVRVLGRNPTEFVILECMECGRVWREPVWRSK